MPAATERRARRKALTAALREQIEHWREHGQWERLKCAELLFVRGWRNKEVAARLGLRNKPWPITSSKRSAALRRSAYPKDCPRRCFRSCIEEDG